MSAPTTRPAGLPGPGLRAAVAAEWTKLWSTRAPRALVAAAVLLMAASTYQVAVNSPPSDAVGPVDVTEPARSAVVVVLLVVVSIAMTAVTSEHATGTITSTLTAVPVRGRVVAAKLVVVLATAVGLGVVLVLVGALVAAVTLPVEATLDVGGALTTLALLCTYLALSSSFTLGLALVLRTAVGTLTAAALLLLALPAALGEAVSPGGAGLALVTGDDAPVLRAGLLLGWAALSVLVGGWRLRARDA